MVNEMILVGGFTRPGNDYITVCELENDHRQFVDLPIKMVMFHSYVSLPEGNHLES